MPVDRTEYATAFDVPDCVQRDIGGTLTCPVYRNGALVAPTQAGSTFSLRKKDGTLLVDGAAVTVASSIATYALAAATIADEPYSAGYRAEWKLIISGVTYNFRNEVYIVRYAPALPISDRNLLGRHTNLARFLAGTGRTTFQTDIETAWTELQRWLIQKGNRINLIVQSTDLVDLLRVWTMKNILFDVKSSANGAQFNDLYEEYVEELKGLKNVNFAYAPDDDTQPETQRRAAEPTTFLAVSGYRRYADTDWER
jgi:hypothetical protein